MIFYRLVYDEKLHLVRPGQHFSSIKDYSLRNSSCYDNCLMLSLIKSIKRLKLSNPFPQVDHQKIFTETFWGGRFFYDDLNKRDYLAGDAQIFPFYFNICEDKKMLDSIIREIQKEGLDSPFPMKYTSKKGMWKASTDQRAPYFSSDCTALSPSNTELYRGKVPAGFPHTKKEKHFIWQENLVPDYEGNSIWAHLGMVYLTVLKKFHREQELKQGLGQYASLLTRHKNFLEVYSPEGKPFSTFFYRADEGMLWASVYLALLTRH